MTASLFLSLSLFYPWLQHAIAYTGAAGEVYGAKATINVWDPTIEGPNEFSLSQIWILSGSFDGSDLNSIEAGWQVLPLFNSSTAFLLPLSPSCPGRR